jgi:carbamoyltransferase
MPNPGDAGGALGAACLGYGRKVNWTGPYLGYQIRNVRTDKQIVTDVVDRLLTKGMVGLAWGREEYGPRALGNRSLLADPRGPDVKDLVNTVKRRQKFRPFAPAVLEEHAKEYFHGIVTPYMQSVAKCLKPNELPAIVHADGTSRVQTVGKQDNTILRSVLEEWYARTGCPVLLNTSLNIRGKPMVQGVVDAINFQKFYGVEVIF